MKRPTISLLLLACSICGLEVLVHEEHSFPAGTAAGVCGDRGYRAGRDSGVSDH